MSLCGPRSQYNQPVFRKPVVIYSILLGILCMVLMILYTVYLRGDYIIEHGEIFAAIIFALCYDMLLPIYIICAAGNGCFIQFRSHLCQKIIIVLWLGFSVIWAAVLVYVFVKLPISFDNIFEYVVLIVTVTHSVLVAVVAYWNIRMYRRFLHEAQELNPGMSFMDAKTLYELVILRKLFTKPIVVPKDKYGREIDNGQLRAFHWDDFYHLNRWIRELNRGDGGLEFVVSEMENRLNIYEVPIGGWRIDSLNSGIHSVATRVFGGSHEIRDKLAALHADDHCQLWHWSQLLRAVPHMPTIGERMSAIETVTEQMKCRAGLYDVAEEAKIWLISLSRHGRHLKVPFGESVEDPRPYGVQIQRAPDAAAFDAERVRLSAAAPSNSRNDHIDFEKY